MRIVLAIIALLAGVLMALIYVGTPVGTITDTCGPINVLGYVGTASIRCDYIRNGSIALAVVCLLVAVLVALSAMPRRTGDTDEIVDRR